MNRARIAKDIWRFWAAATVVAALSFGSQSVAAEVVLKLGHGSAPGPAPLSQAAEAFKKEVEAKSEGRIKVQIYPASQLGEEMTMMNGLKIGVVDATWISTAPMSAAVPEIDLLSLPFLFKSVDHAIHAADGPLGEFFEPKIEAAVGAKVGCWSSLGERDMWNSKHAIRSLEDLKGLKMRTQQSAIQIDTYTALGAEPSPMAYGELYTALQTGVVDGADNGPVDLQEDHFYQVTKYVTLTKHVYVLLPLLISTKFLDQLSADDQSLVLNAAKQACVVVTSVSNKLNQDYIDKLKGEGLEFIDFPEENRKAFFDKVHGVYDKNADRVGGWPIIQKAIDTK